MSYLNYIASALTWAEVTQELNYNYDSAVKPVVIIKDLQGNNYRDTVIRTVQLECFTSDVNRDKALLETFARTYNNTDYTEDFDFVKQYYSTPIVLTNFSMTGNDYSSRIILSGTLIISSNVSDIKSVLIDGELYETSARVLNYITAPDNQASNMSGLINITEIRAGMLKFTCSLVSKSDTITHKLRNIRKGLLPINTAFVIKLIHLDNLDEETHTMKMDSHTINSNNSALPVLTISFSK